MDEESQPKSDGRIEKAYEAWSIDPTPENLNAVVNHLDPAIGYASSRYGGSPHIRHKARIIAADAVRSYNPESGASLPTWARGQLKGLSRYNREMSKAMKVPERSQIDAYQLEKTNLELTDKLGRDPDLEQLADASGFSVAKITKLRKANRPQITGEQAGEVEHSVPDFLDEAVGYVYDELDYRDRKILEHTTGYGGADMLNKSQIAAKLGISNAQVTRRSAALTMRIQELDDAINSIAT